MAEMRMAMVGMMAVDTNKRLESYRDLSNLLAENGNNLDWNSCMSASETKKVFQNLKADLTIQNEEELLQTADICTHLLASPSFLTHVDVSGQKSLCDILINILKTCMNRKVMNVVLQSLAKSRLKNEAYLSILPEGFDILKDILQMKDATSYVVCEALRVVLVLYNASPDASVEHGNLWFPSTFSKLFHSNFKIRKSALDVISKVGETVDKMSDPATRSDLTRPVLAPLKDRYCKDMVCMVANGNYDVLQVWRAIVFLLGTELHSRRNLINCLLNVVEKAFKIADPEVRIESFNTWRAIIDNFALDKNTLTHHKKLQLLLAPFKVSNAKTEETCNTKLHVWWHLLCLLADNRCLVTNFDQAVVPLLNFCFIGGLSSEGNKGGLSNRNLIMSGALSSPRRAFSSLHTTHAEVLAQILAPDCQVPKYNELLPLVGERVMSSSLFMRHYPLLLKCFAEAVQTLRFSDRRQNFLGTLIFSFLLSHVRVVTTADVQKKEVVDMVKELFNTLSHIQNLCHPGDSQSQFLFKFFSLLTEANLALPKKILNSHQFHMPTSGSVDAQDIMCGTLSNHLITQLCRPALLHHSLSGNEFESVWTTVLENSQPVTGKLRFLQAVILELTTSAIPFLCPEQPTVLYNLWNAVLKQMLAHVGKPSSSECDDSEPDWTCIYSVLNFPVIHATEVFTCAPFEIFQQITETWKKLWKKFSFVTSITPTVEPNSEVEHVASTLLNLCQEKASDVPDVHIAFYILTAEVLVLLTESFQYDKLGKAAEELSPSPAKAKKKPHPLHNLASTMELTFEVFEKMCSMVSSRRMYVTEKLCQAALSMIQGIQEASMKYIQEFIPHIVKMLLKCVRVNPAVVFDFKVERKYINLLKAFSGLVKFYITQKAATQSVLEHLNALEPLLFVAYTSTNKKIKQEMQKLIEDSLATISDASLDVPQFLLEAQTKWGISAPKSASVNYSESMDDFIQATPREKRAARSMSSLSSNSRASTPKSNMPLSTRKQKADRSDKNEDKHVVAAPTPPTRSSIRVRKIQLKKETTGISSPSPSSTPSTPEDSSSRLAVSTTPSDSAITRITRTSRNMPSPQKREGGRSLSQSSSSESEGKEQNKGGSTMNPGSIKPIIISSTESEATAKDSDKTSQVSSTGTDMEAVSDAQGKSQTLRAGRILRSNSLLGSEENYDEDLGCSEVLWNSDQSSFGLDSWTQDKGNKWGETKAQKVYAKKVEKQNKDIYVMDEDTSLEAKKLLEERCPDNNNEEPAHCMKIKQMQSSSPLKKSQPSSPYKKSEASSPHKKLQTSSPHKQYQAPSPQKTAWIDTMKSSEETIQEHSAAKRKRINFMEVIVSPSIVRDAKLAEQKPKVQIAGSEMKLKETPQTPQTTVLVSDSDDEDFQFPELGTPILGNSVSVAENSNSDRKQLDKFPTEKSVSTPEQSNSNKKQLDNPVEKSISVAENNDSHNKQLDKPNEETVSVAENNDAENKQSDMPIEKSECVPGKIHSNSKQLDNSVEESECVPEKSNSNKKQVTEALLHKPVAEEKIDNMASERSSSTSGGKRKRKLFSGQEEVVESSVKKRKMENTTQNPSSSSSSSSDSVIELATSHSEKSKNAKPVIELGSSNSEEIITKTTKEAKPWRKTRSHPGETDTGKEEMSKTKPAFSPKMTRSGRKIVAPNKDMPKPMTPPKKSKRRLNQMVDSSQAERSDRSSINTVNLNNSSSSLDDSIECLPRNIESDSEGEMEIDHHPAAKEVSVPESEPKKSDQSGNETRDDEFDFDTSITILGTYDASTSREKGSSSKSEKETENHKTSPSKTGKASIEEVDITNKFDGLSEDKESSCVLDETNIEENESCVSDMSKSKLNEPAPEEEEQVSQGTSEKERGMDLSDDLLDPQKTSDDSTPMECGQDLDGEVSYPVVQRGTGALDDSGSAEVENSDEGALPNTNKEGMEIELMCVEDNEAKQTEDKDSTVSQEESKNNEEEEELNRFSCGEDVPEKEMVRPDTPASPESQEDESEMELVRLDTVDSPASPEDEPEKEMARPDTPASPEPENEEEMEEDYLSAAQEKEEEEDKEEGEKKTKNNDVGDKIQQETHDRMQESEKLVPVNLQEQENLGKTDSASDKKSKPKISSRNRPKISLSEQISIADIEEGKTDSASDQKKSKPEIVSGSRAKISLSEQISIADIKESEMQEMDISTNENQEDQRRDCTLGSEMEVTNERSVTISEDAMVVEDGSGTPDEVQSEQQQHTVLSKTQHELQEENVRDVQGDKEAEDRLHTTKDSDEVNKNVTDSGVYCKVSIKEEIQESQHVSEMVTGEKESLDTLRNETQANLTSESVTGEVAETVSSTSKNVEVEKKLASSKGSVDTNVTVFSARRRSDVREKGSASEMDVQSNQTVSSPSKAVEGKETLVSSKGTPDTNVTVFSAKRSSDVLLKDVQVNQTVSSPCKTVNETVSSPSKPVDVNETVSSPRKTVNVDETVSSPRKSVKAVSSPRKTISVDETVSSPRKSVEVKVPLPKKTVQIRETATTIVSDHNRGTVSSPRKAVVTTETAVPTQRRTDDKPEASRNVNSMEVEEDEPDLKAPQPQPVPQPQHTERPADTAPEATGAASVSNEALEEPSVSIRQQEEELSPDKSSRSRLKLTVSTPERMKQRGAIMKAGSRAALLVACAKQNIKNRGGGESESSASVLTEGGRSRSLGSSPIRRSRPSPGQSPDGRRKSLLDSIGSRPWVKHTPSPGASPSTSILKRTLLTDGLDGETPSPPATKYRRVSFADPPVSDRVEIPPSPRTLRGIRAQKRLDMTRIASEVKDSDAQPEEKQMTQEADPEVLDMNNPVCPALVTCQDRVDQVAQNLTSPAMLPGLLVSLEHMGITTVGQLCKLTEWDVNTLPIKTPKVANTHKVLKEYEKSWRRENSPANSPGVDEVEVNLAKMFGELDDKENLRPNQQDSTAPEATKSEAEVRESAARGSHSDNIQEIMDMEDITPLYSSPEETEEDTLKSLCMRASEDDLESQKKLLHYLLQTMPSSDVADAIAQCIKTRMADVATTT